jgi:DNA-nicking Smr family endonuclease
MKPDELKAIQKRMARVQAQAKATELAARLAAEQAAAQRAANDPSVQFRKHVGSVKPLAQRTQRATIPKAKPAAIPIQRMRDEQAALREALSDEVDVESLLDTDSELSFLRPHVGADVPRKLRRGVWVMQGHIDLHGMTRDQAREALTAFLADSVRQGLRCVRVIHGKGLGSPGRVPVLKSKVRAWLVQHDSVMAFVQAPPTQGGHGAVVVLLAA